MRATWIFYGALLVIAFGLAFAGPVDSEQTSDEPGSGWKTYHAIKNFFRPVTNYFRGLPEKTPTDVATDVKETEKAHVLQDKTFKEMYDDVKGRVSTLDDHIGAWIEQQNAKRVQ